MEYTLWQDQKEAKENSRLGPGKDYLSVVPVQRNSVPKDELKYDEFFSTTATHEKLSLT